MDFKELRNEVQLLRDELAIMKRGYEDLLYNLDDENFSSKIIKEKDGMKTQIEINEKGISTLVSSLDNYSTISQTNNKIAMVVSKSVSASFVSNVKPTRSNTTDEEKGMICEYDGEYYYYNNVSLSWNKCPYQNEIKSLFEQTSDGFNLVGDVSVKGKILSIDETNYTQMSSTGLNVFIYDETQEKWENKIGMGYFSGIHEYPYITLGAGTSSNSLQNVGCICKLGYGLWIGDASIVDKGGDYPGGALESPSDFPLSSKNATGIFIDLQKDTMYKYINGVCSELASGDATFG